MKSLDFHKFSSFSIKMQISLDTFIANFAQQSECKTINKKSLVYFFTIYCVQTYEKILLLNMQLFGKLEDVKFIYHLSIPFSLDLNKS